MCRVPIAAFLLVLANAAARAEDFSGFYAGIDAGYAAGRDRERIVDRPAPVAAARDGAGLELPPSSIGAASAMRRPGQGAHRGNDAR